MRKLLIAAALSLTAIAGCAKSDTGSSGATKKADEEKFPKMTVDEVDQALAAKQAQPVDCNGDGTRKQMGVVPGAILVTDDESFAATELPPDKTTKLVFYCADPG
jgi:hypothetical protein